MNFLQYSNNRFQEILVSSSRDRNFSTWRDAEQNSLQMLLAIYRFIFKILVIPKIFVNFALVNFGLKTAPLPEVDLLEAQNNSAELARKNSLAKKVGYKTAKDPLVN